MLKKVLGLDIGTNSIGWAFIETDTENQVGRIIGLGSRVIPMDGDTMNKFESGNPVSKTADRREKRGARRLLQRYKLRRSRLIKVLKTLNWLPVNFPNSFKDIGKFNINDYATFSKETINEAKAVFNSDKISTDWVIYYLRTKALKYEITITELARILYHFNQRRGFKSSRKDNKEEKIDESTNYPIIEKWVEIIKIESVTEISDEKEFKTFEIKFSSESGTFIALKKKKNRPDWDGKKIEFNITKTTTKAGIISYNLSEPDPDKWEEKKKAHEKDLVASGLYIGQYYLKHLVEDRNYRIKQRIIDRSFYKAELRAIWNKQAEFHPELKDVSKIPIIANELYKHNDFKKKELISNDLFHLIMNDIIYYQRDLKSQKHLIAECRYEQKKDDKGNKFGIKVTPKSSPLFQEFRIWQTINNLKILEKEGTICGKTKIEIDYTDKYLTQESKALLFKLFDSRELVSEKAILDELGFKRDRIEDGEKTHSFKLNYPKDTDFKGNETKALFRRIFKKHHYENEGDIILNNNKMLEMLWHMIYSIKEDTHLEKALEKHFQMPVDIARHISKLPEFSSQYASFSAKALHKLLPLMRAGKYWKEENINASVQDRINKILNGEYDLNINDQTRKQIQEKCFKDITDFKGLGTFLVCYIVYGRHSEREDENKFESFDEINVLKMLPNKSMRNPIVEQITRETLNIVKDIWKSEALGRPDEIHIELGRELKNNAIDRKKISEQNQKNKTERERIIAILKELQCANPNSPSDIEKFQIWKDTGGKQAKENFNSLFKNNKEISPLIDKLNSYKKLYWAENEDNKEPSSIDIDRYRLWAEQHHISPYTGKIIPLSKLFTTDYEIEHIVPRSRFFDDSFGNKIICESEVNKEKDNRLGLQFIEECCGKSIILSNGTTARIFSIDEYKAHINRNFNGKKKRQLLLNEVPEEFLTRQLNDTRYIGRTLGNLLYPIAKDNAGIIFTNGAITSELKSSWGLHNKWKQLLEPRFRRLQEITGEQLIEYGKNNDLRFKKDYKRIDHRHHALDALIIACTSRQHIKYLNTLNAFNNDKIEWEKYFYLLNGSKRLKGETNGIREFAKPWETFTNDTYNVLQGIIVSHKNVNRVISKPYNKYLHWKEVEPGKWVKIFDKQVLPIDPEKKWVAVRKSMFKEPLGKIKIAEYRKGVEISEAIKIQYEYLVKFSGKLQSRIANKEYRNIINQAIRNCENNLDKVLSFYKKNQLKDYAGNTIDKLDILDFNEYAAKRVALDSSFTIDKINNMPYANHPKNWLTSLLREHLFKHDNDPKKAFVGEGLEELYKKAPYPINKVTRKESGEKIDLNGKLFETDKGGNMFFIIYENIETGKRNEMYTLPLFEAIMRLANNLPLAESKEGFKTIIISPNDLVYVPETDSEGNIIENIKLLDWKNESVNLSSRIYKMVSCTGSECHFIHHSIASLIMPYDNKLKVGEFGSINKSEKTLDNRVSIKKVCIKLKHDRLGNICPA